MFAAIIYLITKLLIVALLFVIIAFVLVNLFHAGWWLITYNERKEHEAFIKQAKQYPRKKFNSDVE